MRTPNFRAQAQAILPKLVHDLRLLGFGPRQSPCFNTAGILLKPGMRNPFLQPFRSVFGYAVKGAQTSVGGPGQS